MIPFTDGNKKAGVSIICTTYNHEEYIKEAIEGFLKQKTNFPCEVLIHDDASTDGTAKIIEEYAERYPEFIFPILQQENQLSQGISIVNTFLLPLVRGKYIARCEGDDYWCDELKLQKQYDALQQHPQSDMCACGAKIVDAESGNIVLANDHCNEHTLRIMSADEVIVGGGGYVQTAGFFYRVNAELYQFAQIKKYDYTLQIAGALRGGIVFIPDVMVIYRKSVPNGATYRLSQNSKKKLTHCRDTIKMLKALNVETEGKHFVAIMCHISRIRISMWKIAIQSLLNNGQKQIPDYRN